jgi:hypothetical protein
MYVQECIAREKQRERLRQAEQTRAAGRLAELRRLEKRQRRAERELLHAWERVQYVRARLEAV